MFSYPSYYTNYSYYILLSGPPEAPTNCSSSSASSLSMKIICQNGSDQGYRQSFNLLVFNRSLLWRNLSDASKPEFEVTGLEPGREYLASVYAVNEKGQSRRINFTFQGFNEPIGQPTVAESGNDNKRLTGILTPTILTVIILLLLHYFIHFSGILSFEGARIQELIYSINCKFISRILKMEIFLLST
jgi:hypothetical protein